MRVRIACRAVSHCIWLVEVAANGVLRCRLGLLARLRLTDERRRSSLASRSFSYSPLRGAGHRRVS